MNSAKLYNLTDSSNAIYLWDFDPNHWNRIAAEYRENPANLPDSAFKFHGLDSKKAIPLGRLQYARRIFEIIEDTKSLKDKYVNNPHWIEQTMNPHP